MCVAAAAARSADLIYVSQQHDLLDSSSVASPAADLPLQMQHKTTAREENVLLFSVFFFSFKKLEKRIRNKTRKRQINNLYSEGSQFVTPSLFFNSLSRRVKTATDGQHYICARNVAPRKWHLYAQCLLHLSPSGPRPFHVSLEEFLNLCLLRKRALLYLTHTICSILCF